MPVLRMIHAPVEEIRSRSEAFASRLSERAPGFEVMLQEAQSAVGGGAAPNVGVPTVVVSLVHPSLGPDRLATALRAGDPPIVVRVAEDRLVLDLRTVRPEDETTVLEALAGSGRG